MKLIVFGVEQMNPGIDAMKASDLFLQRNELIPLLNSAGNGDAADGEFYAQLRFDRGGEDGVVAVDDGEFLRSIFEGEREDRDFGPFDVLGKVGVRTFGADAAFLSGDDLRGILNAVENAVMHLLQDIVGSDRSAGVVEMATAAITGGGGKQGAVGCLDVEAQEAELLNQRNQGMENFQITTLPKAATEVGKGGATRDGIVPEPGKGAIGLPQPGIVQAGAEGFAVGDLVEIAAGVEDEKRDRIVTRGAEDGIGVGGEGADEREMDGRGA